MKEFVAGSNEEDVRLSRFVLRVTHRLPSAALYKAFRNKRIKVNGKRAGADTRLRSGDVVQLYLNDTFFDAQAAAPVQAHTANAFAQLPPPTTLWEDAQVAVLVKPAGVLSHGDGSNAPTLIDAFVAELTRRGEYNAQNESSFVPAIANRLDRGTEGLVLAAKTHTALRDLNELIRLDLVAKTYLCIAVGRVADGIHYAFSKRDTREKRVRVTAEMVEGAKPIATDVEVLEHKNGLSLCRIGLLTGRTHQIRAHLAFLDAPLLGDRKYGNAAANKRHKLANQALCAWKLTFAGVLPNGNTLQQLAGRQFAVPAPSPLAVWERMQAEPNK